MLLMLATAFALSPRPPLPQPELFYPPLPETPIARHALRAKGTDALRLRAAGGALRSTSGVPTPALDAVTRRYDLRFRPLLDLDAQRVASLESRAAALSGRQQPDLLGMMEVIVPEGTSMLEVARALDAVQDLEWVQIIAIGAPPPGDIAPATGDYTSLQGWLEADPGLDFAAAWALGIDGSRVRVSDVEYGWEASHEDLVDRDLQLESGQIVPSFVAEYGWDSHGTAAFGEIVAVQNGYGITGSLYAAESGTYPEYTDAAGSRRAAAITSAAADSAAGDVVMLEMQANGRSGYGPAELDLDVWTASQVAVDAGVVVVGAAGNGSQDLDAAYYDANYTARGDSGAIIVGAGSADSTHVPLYFSTYGARVNLQGWGESVFTLGYGDYATVGGDPDQAYTSAFNGTSSATPLVAGAAGAMQDYAWMEYGAPLAPRALRQLLIDTGTAQGAGDPIGPLPNLAAARAALDADLDGAMAATYGGDDCNDADAAAYPGAPDDPTDGVDTDCDGVDESDVDADGELAIPFGGTDCNDQDASINTLAEELWYDGVDQNCDGNDADRDLDGETATVVGGPDCNDDDPAVLSTATETWYDGVDQDCDGNDTDRDGDGHAAIDMGGDDCDDLHNNVYPGAPESPGADHDCDGEVDVAEVEDTGEDKKEPEDPCGCATGPEAGGLMLAAAGLLVLRRRR